jgi:hypothetical protein
MNTKQNFQNRTEALNYDNSELVHVFIPPFRVGRKQMRAVLDAKGYEVVVFPKGLESYAKEYASFLNITRK